MNTLDWCVFVAAWSLIPGCLLAKVCMDIRNAKSERRLQERVNAIMRSGKR